MRSDPLNLIRVMPAKGRKKCTSTKRAAPASINVIGAGIAGAWQALLFAKAGHKVTLFERSDPGMTEATSHWAGGMLAPYCEGETAEYLITRLGLRSLDLWREALPQTPFNGSLVVAHPRDRADFERFARLAGGHKRIGAGESPSSSPSRRPLPRGACILRRRAMSIRAGSLPALARNAARIRRSNRIQVAGRADDLDGMVIDCRGIAARDDTCPDLRGVKGEIIIVETAEIALSRPVRLVHPRWPLYIVPRAGNRFLIGATSIEADDDGVSVRSALELLTGAYAVHPAFGEARIVDLGAALRPAFPDNLPRVTVDDRRITVNGLYRHGFLLAPALAEVTVALCHGRTH